MTAKKQTLPLRRDRGVAPSMPMSRAGFAGGSEAPQAPDSTRPLRILILGGTGFIGPHQVCHAIKRGHKLTLFNRGSHGKQVPALVDLRIGDRDAKDYAALEQGDWDVCIDNHARLPGWVRDASAMLQGRVKHYIFISTISVYATHALPHQDEHAACRAYSGADAFAQTSATLRDDMTLYGPLKAVCEAEVLDKFPDMTTIVRPGLIVGPGDETDRFTYWPVRLACGGKTLVPPQSDPVQYIDVRDLAQWTIALAERRVLGTFNAIGPASPISMGQLLEAARQCSGNRAKLVEAPQEFLDDQQVQAWSELPVWVPGTGQTAGFHRRCNQRALAAGLSIRPLLQTLRDTLEWWNTLDASRRAALRAGLKPAREAELLALLKA